MLQDESDENRHRCAGMYSQNLWGGPVDPFILVRFDKYDGPDDPIVSLVIFEWKDEEFVGVYPSSNAIQVCVNPPEDTSWYL